MELFLLRTATAPPAAPFLALLRLLLFFLPPHFGGHDAGT
jgi:hypothetical protein